MKYVCFLAIIAASVLNASAQTSPFPWNKQWRLANGQTLQASHVSFQGSDVKLISVQGDTVTIPISRLRVLLRPLDQKYLKALRDFARWFPSSKVRHDSGKKTSDKFFSQTMKKYEALFDKASRVQAELAGRNLQADKYIVDLTKRFIDLSSGHDWSAYSRGLIRDSRKRQVFEGGVNMSCKSAELTVKSYESVLTTVEKAEYDAWARAHPEEARIREIEKRATAAEDAAANAQWQAQEAQDAAIRAQQEAQNAAMIAQQEAQDAQHRARGAQRRAQEAEDTLRMHGIW